MKISQIVLLGVSSIEAQLAETALPAAVSPFNYDNDDYQSYEDNFLDERKVPNRHPKARLRTLGTVRDNNEQVSKDLFVEAFSYELLDKWFDHIPSQDNWKMKFATNIQRMRY